jgi:Carboxypeptidase regulatory-like domain
VTKNPLRSLELILPLLPLFVWPVAAQSPNTASIIVDVADQNGAVVKDAKVTVVNTATGATREALSGSDGSATFPALSLTGTYMVSISKEGFGNEERKDITLLSGETARLNVTLLVGSSQSEVTV